MIPTSETFWYWPGNFPIAQMDRPCDVCKQISEGEGHDAHDDQPEPVQTA